MRIWLRATAKALIFLALGVTPAWTAGEAQVGIRYLGQIGTGEGLAWGQMRTPSGVAAFGKKVFVADTDNHRVQIFSAEGTFQKAFGTKGKGPGELHTPRGLAISEDGEIYVAERGNARISVFHPDGTFVRNFGQEILSKPEALALGANERLFVADAGTGRIEIFSRDGLFLGSQGTVGKNPGNLREPVGIAAISDGSIIVADAASKTLVRFAPGDNAGEIIYRAEILGLCVDEEGRIYALDKNTSQILLMDGRGKLFHTFGSPGQGRGQFQEARSLAFPVRAKGEAKAEPKNGEDILVVANTRNERVDRFAIEVHQEAPPLKRATDRSRFERGRVRESKVLAEARTNEERFLLNAATGQVFREPLPERVQPAAKESESRALVFGYAATVKEGPLKEATALTVSAKDDLLYYAESANDQVHALTRRGEEKFVFGGSGSDAGKLKKPAALQLFRDELYVADTGNRRIQVFSRDGVFLRAVSSKTGALKKPSSLAVDSRGAMIVGDPAANKVLRFAADGSELAALDGYTELVALALDANDWLYVLDHRSAGTFLQIRDRDLQIVETVRVDLPGAEFSPTALSVLSGAWNEIRLFDPQHGREVQIWMNPAPSQPVSVALLLREDNSDVLLSAAQETFLDKYRLYQLRAAQDAFPTLLSEGKLEALAFKRPVGEPPYWFALARVSKNGLESSLSKPLRDYYHEGIYHYERGEDEEAAKAFAAQQRESNPHGPSLKYLAMTFSRNGHKEEAEKVYELLAQVPEYRAYSEVLKGQMYLQARDYAKAEQIFRDLRLKNPDSEEILVGLAEALSAQGQSQRAIATLEEAVRLHPKSARLYLRIGDNYLSSQLYEKAKESYEKAVALAPSDADGWVALSRAQVKLHQQEAAVASLNKALLLEAAHPAAVIELTDLYLKMQRYGDAEKLLEKLPPASQNQASVMALKGRILAARGKVEDAIAQLQAATEGGQAGAEVHEELARLQAGRGNWAKAAKSYRDALALQKQDYETWTALGLVLLQMKEWDQAKEAFGQAFSYSPGYGPAFVGLGDLEYGEKHFDLAEDAYSKALASRDLQGDAGVRIKLGLAQAAQKKTGEAVATLEEAVRLDPKNATAQYELGRLCLENSFIAKAEKALTQAALLDPRRAEIHYALGQMHLKKFRFDEATIAFAEAARLNPNEPAYREALNQTAQKKRQALETNPNAPLIDVLDLPAPKIFAAIYKTYAKRSLGEFKFRNNSEQVLDKVTVSFFVREFMDLPTITSLKAVAGHEVVVSPLKATFSNKILDISEDSKVQAQVKLTYTVGGAEKRFETTIPVQVLGRNALLWTDAEMIGAFITPKDPPVAAFARGVEKQLKAESANLVGELASGMKIFAALGAIKMTYVQDPNNPYAKVSRQTGAVDNVQFPRDTLQGKTGDCDDLVVLYASLMESLGIETELLEIPGHVFLAFKTKVPAAQFAKLTNNKDLLLIDQGAIWIPVEMTVVGSSFNSAWFKGAEQVQRAQGDQLRKVSVHEAWKRYEPVTLPATNAVVAAPSAAEIVGLLREDLDVQKRKQVDKESSGFVDRLHADKQDSEARIALGLVYARNQNVQGAREQFEAVLKEDPKNTSALVNLGNLYLKQGDVEGAIGRYLEAETYAKMDPEIKVNLALAYYQKKAISEAREKFKEAEKLAPDVAQENRYLKSLLFD